MLSFIRLGTISLVLVAASFLLVHLSTAEEKTFPSSGVLSEDPPDGTLAREVYEGDVIAYKQYRAAGYVAPFKESLGNIIGKLEYWTALNEGDIVFIDIGSDKGANVGDHFSIISKGRDILDPVKRRDFEHEERYLFDKPYRHDVWVTSPFFLPDEVGPLTLQVGILKITETSGDKSKAVILTANSPIFIGDSLGRFSFDRPAMVANTYVPPRKNIRGHILAHKGYSPTVDGSGEIMYINVGTANNVANGDRFVAYVIPQTEDEKIHGGRVTHMLEHTVGELVVVRVAQNTATVMVLKATQALAPGTRVKSKR